MQSTTQTYAAKKQALAAENPFYGKKELLLLSQQLNKGQLNKIAINNLLTTTFKALTTKEDKEMFYIALFASGDIANREHNMFKKRGIKNVDKGGNSQRKTFIYILSWILDNQPDQFYRFLPIIGEYTNLENPFMYQIRTDRKKGTVLETLSVVPAGGRVQFIEKVTDYFSKIIRDPKTTSKDHELIAKFLKKPRFSKRKRITKKGEVRRSELQPATVMKELFEFEFVTKLSEKLGWEIEKHKLNTRFVGFEKYKAMYNRSSEAYLFSSKEILGYDEDQFKTWLETLPSGARYNVQKRLMDKDGKSKGKWIGKYGDLAVFYNNWIKQKESASVIARDLESKLKSTGDLNDEEKVQLAQATKAAKVNTGATSFMDIIEEFFHGGKSEAELNTIADNLLRKVNIDVPVMTIVDTSGSMNSHNYEYKGKKYHAIDIARLAATIMMLKNPDPELKEVLVKFDDIAEIMIEGKQYTGSSKRNRFSSAATVTLHKLIDDKDSFLKNFKRIKELLFTRGSTDFTTVVSTLKNWAEEIPAEEAMRKEMIRAYPVMLIISDGDLNHRGSPDSSILDAQMKLKQWFGWDGVIVLWDVKSHETSVKFDNLENIIYYPFTNPQVLDQIFSKITDVDVIDIYTSLKSLYLSNRYEPVKSLVI